jgi:hypothetical protein
MSKQGAGVTVGGQMGSNSRASWAAMHTGGAGDVLQNRTEQRGRLRMARSLS